MRPPTIRDVAERAGVSKSLVSLVLRGSDQVRPERRQAVLAAVEELGYRPNAAARSLSERRTRSVGVLLHDMRNPWFVELLDGLNSRLHDSGLHMLLADGHLNRRLGDDLTRTFTELRVDGLIAVGTLPPSEALRAAAAQIPTVVAGAREPALPRVDIVANDDEHGARLATEHLIGLGHRRIAHIAGQGVVGELRRRSFETVMREHALAGLASVEEGDLTEEGGYRAMVRLLSAPQRPSAVFAFNDIACVGALSAAEESGLQVPRDLSLVGYDNTYLSRLRHLWLTTVDNASHDVGRRAAQHLLDRITDPARPSETVLATPTLEVRGTTAPPSTTYPAPRT
ncbi:LacI family DNA-binding transcriptional regulator [Streptomyces europaeiscabiei]|uniref:LacI family DNA-binding transcriptional regulator n=1 Tax=Streptomyces europaeiscabiei TaxID=146819 RepID=A0ABU4NUH3_9ACTN|nr:LacI family DNA-binding transcriptional regulator [Streptomyces europaeiscabiei]MDX2524844.1 LacI family DNA-binding transcriptional regulator [Streptomyces europaeiscabiei]MDX3549950.1 LacI family DNA-binding transcriptional regulator [Streptomyces europaeiscabiei]MDX3558694.1 LacI family DNA-binding transcriptional regulator [Streptomyces europaeiscabiei]MDX3673018.1 LacI family DNA-binding transcriptional regulator [Streptomyces europaeiscabiei]MDX3705748.1 LacI family DNA-binding transc